MAVIGRQDLFGRITRALGARPAHTGLDALSEPVRRIVEIGLVLILGVQLAKIFLSVATPLPTPQGDMQARPAVGRETANAPVKSPFLATASEPEPANAAPAVAETTLDLTLTGVWAEASGGSATIRTPDGEQSRFDVGDTIVSGVTLDAVFPDQVTINRNGVREALRFESKIVAQSSPPPAAPRERPDSPKPPASIASASLGELASVLRVAPSTDSDGRLVIEIYATRNRVAFAALGLKDGDRLVSIDGAPAPTDPDGLSAAFNQLQRKGASTVVIERNGERIPISLSLSALEID